VAAASEGGETRLSEAPCDAPLVRDVDARGSADLRFVKDQMGHASLEETEGTYGTSSASGTSSESTSAGSWVGGAPRGLLPRGGSRRCFIG